MTDRFCGTTVPVRGIFDPPPDWEGPVLYSHRKEIHP